MNHSMAVHATRPRHLLMVVALLALAFAAPRALSGADALPGTEARKCTDTAWADYNSCLVEASGWFDRKVCDIAFEVDYLYCASRAFKAVKDNIV